MLVPNLASEVGRSIGSHWSRPRSPGDLTLRAGQSVGMVTTFSGGGGGKLRVEIDPTLAERE
jgi:hypothetical protein